jgi:hypothetical protein
LTEESCDKVSARGFRRRTFLIDTGRAALGFACVAAGRRVSAQNASPPAIHNMLIVGKKTTFLYHLPMFSFPGFASPRRYQVIVEATFTQLDRSLQDDYAALLDSDSKRGVNRKPETRFYTFGPERFAFSSLNNFPKTLRGTIFRGHLEKKGSEPIFKDVVANIQTIVFFRELFEYKGPGTTKDFGMIYIMFGREREIFMAHYLMSPPDFDQIVSLKDTKKSLADYLRYLDIRTLPKPFVHPHLLVSFGGTGNNILSKRPRPNQSITGRISGSEEAGLQSTSEARRHPLLIGITIDKECYFEEGELRAPPEYATTPAEKAAGFP